MTPDAPPPLAASLIMPFGFDPTPAVMLAEASGVALQDYDLAALTQALGQGLRCVVVWSGPQTAVAQALRNATPPSAAAADWRAAAQALLRLFARNRRKLVLVEAGLITRAAPADLTRLAARVPLTGPIVPPIAPAPDLPALLARLLAANLTDLRPILGELQASSLSIPEETLTSADIDPLAAALTDQQAQLQSRITDADLRHETETDLHHAAMADLSRALSDAGETLAQLRARQIADDQRLTRLDLESQLLRDQLVGLSGALTQSDADLQTKAQTTQRQGAEAGLLRDQLADLSGALSDESAAHQTELHAAHARLQAERTQLQAQQTLTFAELDLVRAQLQSLTGGLGLDAAPPDHSTELALLREQLVSLSSHLTETPPAQPDPAFGDIESAFAALLGALVTETDLRMQTQRAVF